MILYAKHGESFQIDDEDYERVAPHSWYLNKYIKTHIAQEIIYLHIFLLGKAPIGFVWDHIDRDIFNNRRSNLRIVTPSENALNRRDDTATSGFPGIYKRKTLRGIRWETYLPARLDPLKIGIYLGIKDSIEDALVDQELAKIQRTPKC